MTFIATLRSDEIDARHVLEGPIDRATFSPWVEQSLTTTLKPSDCYLSPTIRSNGDREQDHGIISVTQVMPLLSDSSGDQLGGLASNSRDGR